MSEALLGYFGGEEDLSGNFDTILQSGLLEALDICP